MFPPRAPFFKRGGNHVPPRAAFFLVLETLLGAVAPAGQSPAPPADAPYPCALGRGLLLQALPVPEDRHGQARDRERGSGDAYAPPDAADVVVPADQAVDREAAGTGCGYGDGDRRERKRELDAAVAVEEAVPPVDDENRVHHHHGDAECRERGQEPECEGQAAGLGEPGEECQRQRHSPSERLEEPGGAAQPGAAEPAEELLRAVGEHRPADHYAEQQESV